ncbi:heme ABC transporter permease CcmC [Ignatzschineria indica]|uniref:heme ABC transporter permease CcmC n=1 Tax=Ignatzschineria indica TaxID=472583 RepID=UPI0025781DF1|nr:heme ABC transporter permease CcmC [Ignatzschineria indica]
MTNIDQLKKTSPKESKKPRFIFFKRLISYKYFTRLAKRIIPWAFLLSAIFAVVGLYYGLFDSPVDYQQGDTVRIMYIHVPAAILSSGLYMFIAFMSVMYLIFRIKLFPVIARATAVLGAVYTLITLVTGAIWGAPTWGTWWVWDVRLTSVLILFFLYLGYIGLDSAFEDREKANMGISILAIIGVVIVPIIKASVYLFATLHQKSTLFASGGPSLDPAMFKPLMLMLIAYLLFTVGYILLKSTHLIYKEQLLQAYTRQ